METKRLYIRFSSLGDIILCLSVVAQPGDFLTLDEYKTLAQGHPFLKTIIGFEKKKGLRGFLKLCYYLAQQEYTAVYDLHCSLRSFLLKIVFRIYSPKTKFYILSKQTLKFFAVMIFKKYLPAMFQPQSLIQRLRRLMSYEEQFISLRYLLKNSMVRPTDEYICMMPSAAWPGKEWGCENFFELSTALPFLVVVLGTSRDVASIRLIEKLNHAGKAYLSGLNWSLSEVAEILVGANFFIGNDTGIAHLAQNLGVRSYILYGPTAPALGYPPWSLKAQAIEVPLGCRPCGKNGQFCYRWFDSYACFKRISVQNVLKKVQCSG